MDHVLMVGGTKFIGRHTVELLLERDYEVTLFTRGESGNPFADREGVNHVQGDRRDEQRVREVAGEVDYDAVIDTYGMFPADIEVAVDAFDDAEAYVYVSSGSAYGGAPGEYIPMREDETPLEPCTDEQAVDESMETYGARKAECDRVVFDAATDDFRATVVRPMLVYGPHDYTERTDYWIDRIANHDRIVVPGDGDSLLHRVYVEDVASGLVTVMEDGESGEAYNVADRQLVTLEGKVERFAAALDTEVEVVHASARDLADADLEPTAFPLYTPTPAVVTSEKLHGLGWESTALDTAYERTVEEHLDSDRDGRDLGPDRDAEEQVIDALTDE